MIIQKNSCPFSSHHPPLALVAEPHCEHCSATGGNLKTCSRCKVALYCSEEHQRADWRRHKLHCVSPQFEADMAARAEAYAEKLSHRDDAELLELALIERRGVRDFILGHPFPSKERILRFVQGEAQYPIRGKGHLLKYPLAKRLWEDGSIESLVEKYKEVRRVGFLLSKSLEQMQFHFYLIQHILCGGGIFPEVRETYGLYVAPVVTYAKVMETAWDEVDPWRA